MDDIRPMLVIVSMILGLGVTRVLTSLVTVFRLRLKAHIDWLPVVWAVALFFNQIQFWWGINDEPFQAMHWRLEGFLLFIAMPILLFVAAALLLPAADLAPGQSLRAYFEEEGRFALLALAFFEVTAIAANQFLFGETPLSFAGVSTVALGLLQLVTAFGTRRLQVVATIVYLPLLLVSSAVISDV